jgi:hypothetical protein
LAQDNVGAIRDSAAFAGHAAGEPELVEQQGRGAAGAALAQKQKAPTGGAEIPVGVKSGSTCLNAGI